VTSGLAPECHPHPRVKVEVVIIARASREANRALIASTVILGERRKQGKAGPVSAIDRQIRDLIAADHRSRLGGTTFGGSCGSLDVDRFRNRSYIKLSI
jgi:hypothetical protein